ncbi:MAG: pyruvate ferredoxin oxidoreductase, partial [Nitrospinota bacterium]
MATAAQAKGADVQLLTGSEVMANIVRLADVDVITAYPIRPYDTVMQFVSRFIANGEFDADYIPAESEHGQFEIVKHASACGARVFTGSSGVGWLYAMEPLAVTAGLRLPMVALVGCRALDDPGAFGTEHNDAMLVRDLGWLLTFPDTAQEVVELGLLAYRVAEDPKVFLPCAIAMDGAFLTHSQATVRVPSQAQVNQFLPPYNRGDMLLHPDNPITIAPQANEDWLMEIRRQSSEAAKRAYTVLKDAHRDFCRIFGERTDPFLDEYMTEDADVVLCGLGTLSLPVKVAIREMRKEGKKVGLVRLKWFRPFPTEELRASLSRFKAVGVVDRDYS